MQTHIPVRIGFQVSNLVFILFSPLLLYLFHDYARTINRGIYLIWCLFAIIGIASAYFHATLSLLGQLLDELSILWLLSAAFAMWLPRHRYPKLFNANRRIFQRTVFASSLFMTLLACLYPAINSFFLVSTGVPVFILLFEEIKKYANTYTVLPFVLLM